MGGPPLVSLTLSQKGCPERKDRPVLICKGESIIAGIPRLGLRVAVLHRVQVDGAIPGRCG